MMKLSDCKTIDFQSKDGLHGSRARTCRSVPVEEPIRVRVRIRHYAEAAPEVRQIRPTLPDIGRLPVGATLDCYM